MADVVYDELVRRGRAGEPVSRWLMENWVTDALWSSVNGWVALGILAVDGGRLARIVDMEGRSIELQEEEEEDEGEEEEEESELSSSDEDGDD